MQTARSAGQPANDDACPTPSRARQRHNEKVGGGYFVFRRGTTTGRIKTGFIRRGQLPFEHPDFVSAMKEAGRLADLYGGTYDVFGFAGSVTNGTHHGGQPTPTTTN